MKRLSYKIIVLGMLFVSVLGTSCVSQKQLSYFNGVTEASSDSINQSFSPQREASILCGDMLSIIVNAMDVEAAVPFNQPIYNIMRPSGSAQVAQSGGTLQPYTVDKDGCINFPVLGKVHLEGMTISEATDTLTFLIAQSIHNPIVNIHFVNFNVTVLGEVKNPGQFSFAAERVTLLEALGRAGDLTAYGVRNNVLITRETNGKLEFARVNLNDASLYTSPFYYLQQNDVVYVQPNKVRAVSSQNISLYLSTLTTLGSLTTVIISVVNFAGRNK